MYMKSAQEAAQQLSLWTSSGHTGALLPGSIGFEVLLKTRWVVHLESPEKACGVDVLIETAYKE